VTEGPLTPGDVEPAPAGAIEPAAPAAPAGATAPAAPAEPAIPPGPIIELASNRRLVSASFELLGRANDDMRRASFYIGSVVLGTVGPLVLTTWAVSVVAIERADSEMEALLGGAVGAALAVTGLLALIGLLVAGVESRTLAVAMLGGRMAGRPITPRQALARSRRVFWRAVVAAIIVGIPLAIAQAIAGSIVEPMLGEAIEASVITTLLVTVTVGAPFAYVLAGVVLGDVDPVEAVRRSFRVFRVRKLAAVVVVAFETIALLLIFLGVSTGLDIVLRVLGALGLGVDSGPAGLALMTGGIVAAVFAFGTLVFTVIGITVAPQVVMFVGLTHATMGLDRVRPGGADDPDAPQRPGGSRFRTWTRLMLVGFFAGGLLLAVAVAAVIDR
jgi:hypothetical protein